MDKMKIKNTFYLILILNFLCGFSFAGDKPESKISNLNPWKGDSVSIVQLYKGQAGDKFFKEVTKYAPKGYDKQMVKDYILNMFALKFKSISITDEKTIIIDNSISGDYSYIGSVSTKWQGHETTWQIFKTDSSEMIEAGFKYFLFFPFHQHGKDSLRHSHLRYGNENFDFLVTDPSVQSWWPTIYQPSVTDEAKVMKGMIKKAKLQASMLPKLKKPIK